MRFEEFHEPEVEVVCLNCGKVFDEGELLVESADDENACCPFCGSTHIENADVYTSSDSSY